MRSSSLAVCVTVAGLMAVTLSSAPAQTKKKKPTATAKPAPTTKNEVKKQGQLAGASAQFGVTYTLKNSFNFTLLSARYTLEPYIAYALQTVGTEQKGLVLEIAVKNVSQQDNFFNSDGLFTLVDEKGQLYTGASLALKSSGATGPNTQLRPGQGLGQQALKDPLTMGFLLPMKARIVKIMLNTGRLGKTEDVLRYYVAGATREEAGEPGDPKNLITPLPESVRDPADKSGAVALPEGQGKRGVYLPSGYFALRLDDLTTSMEALNGNPPDEGKKFVIATFTAKNLTPTEVSMFDVTGGDFPFYEILDTDGERTKPSFYRKAKLDDDPEHTFKQDDEYTFRAVFVLPKAATVKQLTGGTGKSRKWVYDAAALK